MNSSLQRFLRDRERFVHISKPLVQEAVVLIPERTIGGVVYPAVTFKRTVVTKEPGTTHNVGMNAAKRTIRKLHASYLHAVR